jgi:uncharacterized protein
MALLLPLLETPFSSPMTAEAERRFREAAPRSPWFHLLKADHEMYLLVVDGTRLYRIDTELAQHLPACANDASAIRKLFQEWGLDSPPHIDNQPLAPPPLRAISLAVAQKCNLGCTYCYAQQGDFGEAAKSMPLPTALSAVEALIVKTPPGERVNIAFLGGEPLMARNRW